MKALCNLYDEVIGLENLFRAAKATLARGRRYYGEGARFQFDLEREVFRLHEQLARGSYRHGRYKLFRIWDPKPRTIAAAAFRDRVVHHAVHDVIEPRLDRLFIHDSYACRKGKGTHAAIDRAHSFLRANRYALHLDAQNYFQNIDHARLKALLRRYIADSRLLALLEEIVDSTAYLAANGYKGDPKRRVSKVAGHVIQPAEWLIDSRNRKFAPGARPRSAGFDARPTSRCRPDIPRRGVSGDWSESATQIQLSLFGEEAGARVNCGVKGLPLGNLTSQFFANLYLNELDQYVKHRLKARYYLRYMDDMMLFGVEKNVLQEWDCAIRKFAATALDLQLHPTGGPVPVSTGVAFLGFRLFPGQRKLKRTSVSRFIRRMNDYTERYFEVGGSREDKAGLLDAVRRSVRGFNAHAAYGNTHRIRKILYDRFPIINQYGLAGMRAVP